MDVDDGEGTQPLMHDEVSDVGKVSIVAIPRDLPPSLPVEKPAPCQVLCLSEFRTFGTCIYR